MNALKVFSEHRIVATHFYLNDIYYIPTKSEMAGILTKPATTPQHVVADRQIKQAKQAKKNNNANVVFKSIAKSAKKHNYKHNKSTITCYL